MDWLDVLQLALALWLAGVLFVATAIGLVAVAVRAAKTAAADALDGLRQTPTPSPADGTDAAAYVRQRIKETPRHAPR
jgi:hypothetical protein